MPTDKLGNKLTWKEYFARWKKGIEGITASQQTKSQINFTVIILIGIACGWVMTLFAFKTLWWLTIILTGAFLNTIVGLIGLLQKKWLLMRMEESLIDERGVK
jgi:CHASE2 domain-containing sensor protein